MGRTLVAVVSDLHTNSTVGLCPPRYMREDEGTYVASPAQRWLWRNWLDFWQWIAAQASAYNADRVIGIFAGDITDGDHHDTFEIVSRNPSDILRLVVAAMEPAMEVCDDLLIVRGTRSHVGGRGHYEEKIAEDVSANTLGANRYAHYKLWLNIEGVTFDVRHHTNMGRRPWTEHNAANYLASHVIQRHARRGWRLPDVVIRAHVHRTTDTSTNFRRLRAIILPAWQLATEYVHKIVPNDADVSDIGGYAFICEDGRYQAFDRVYEPKEPRAVRL